MGRAQDSLLADDLAVLDDREKHRLEGYADDVTRARYAGARAAIRRTVARWHDVEPSSVTWATAPCPGCGSDQHGPPRIQRPVTDWQISVSRSERWWMLALSYQAPVGVDIELRRTHEVSAVVRRCLSRAEQAHVAAARSGGGRDDALMRCWVRKEAVSKAWGVGLGTDLARIEVRPEDDHALIRRTAPGGHSLWDVRDVAVTGACLAAVARPAAHAGPVAVRIPTAASS
ncbi:4'-phosphopantetheinyl transferase family protein [Streptomyces sp. NPDC058092]|uniref:4'-phosphopantetheinyl transferase family protein n=1 Tax=Streptomyces sp. NPDC058092 TaxID=3346336 RepID=UPI0036E42FA7